jgi:hypothetical protein
MFIAKSYTLRNKSNFDDEDILEMSNPKYNYLHIKNYYIDFNDNLDRIPQNIIGLTITNDKRSTPFNIPPHIKHIHLYSNDFFVIIPPTVETVKVVSSYIDKFPFFFNSLPYGIKTIELEIYGTCKKYLEYDLNNLPDSIETIFLYCLYDNMNEDEYKDIQIYFKLNKIYPNLTYISFDSNIKNTNYKDIKNYSIRNNIKTNGFNNLNMYN